MTDLRNALARARDEWLASQEGERCQFDVAHGQYLRNRLEMAFIAGWNACEADRQRARDKPWNLYYMRDNHTFRPLPKDIEGAIAAIKEDFANGYSYGMLCASLESEHYGTVVHAHGKARWDEFEVAAREWLGEHTARSHCKP